MGLESHSLLLQCQNPGVRAAVRIGMQSTGYTVARAAIPNEGGPKLGDSETPGAAAQGSNPAAASHASHCRSVPKPTAKAMSHHSN